MRPVSLAAAVAAALGSTSALAAPPTAPSDLRVDVYSGTAAELFWSRSTDPDGLVRGYEIRRDGQLVETRDGLSYFTEELTDGRAFAFTVTAVDFDGERSAPSSVSVVGGDREGAVGSAGGRPPPPANLTSSVYSSSAAEVFWDRSDQRGLSYEVTRNGQTVATTNGTSAFLSGLPRTNGETIDVVAIDANGQRSGAATVTLGGSGSGNPNPPVSGNAPPAPSSLRGEVYSSSAGEVFWDRVSGANLSYEVRLDGETVATTNGTSYFVGNRPGLDGTSIEVVAIGPDGSRSNVSNATLGSGSGGDPNPPTGGGGDGAPDAPSNLRGEVYSSNAGEVFWDRVSGANLSYEVSLDGEVVTTTTGTSYFAGNRPEIDGTSVGVVAIGPDGARSSASSTTLGSGDGSSNPDLGTDAPPAPANARINVYSGTAAELFFDRAPASANVVETEIVRDGETLGTTNGTSFFDPNRTPGRSYTYELVAVNASGARSAATTVGDGTGGNDDSIISVDNRDEILANLLDVFYGRVYEDVYDSARFAFRGEQGRTAVGSGGTPGTGAFECEDGGGGSTLSGSSENFSEEFTGSLSSCLIDGVTYNGTTEHRGNGRSTFEESVSGFSARGPEGELESLTGNVESGRTTLALTRKALSVERYQSTGGRGAVLIEDASTFVTDDNVEQSNQASFEATVTAPWTGGEPLEISTSEQFVDSDLFEPFEQVRYTQGSLTAEAADGSTLILDAANGDPDSFTLTVEAQGSASSFTIPWQPDNLLPCFIGTAECTLDLPTVY